MFKPGPAIRLLLVTALMGLCPLVAPAQGGDRALKAKADALFEKGDYAEAWPMYSQLVSLTPQDHELNYKYGACTIYSGEDKTKAIGYLRFAISGPATPALAWYFLGKAYQLDYRFDEALDAYRHFKGTADRKQLAQFPVEALEKQSRNGKYLLSNLKDIEVLNKVEVPASDYFRFYDLSDIGGKIVVTPDELLTSYDRRSGERFLLYLPTEGGAIYFSSYGRDGKTGRDIYRTELLPNGGYATPRKVAGYVNTDQDEDYAVMGPDGKSFYFSSTGHNSMGGYDVFRSIYDPNMDAFGVPENMDFAVNTPADEMLYIVGPDGAQACFASDRDSRQGQVNVYRVSTARTPLNLTVLKGVYASAFGPVTKPVRIIVEDEVTRERVADVTSDEEGNYVLVLPKGGKYKFLVEDGRMDRAFWTTVEAPPAHQAQAFAQEINLAQPGGGKLEVTTHFDQPLGEDVMALAMDEIRRRARLDVNAGQVVAQEPASAPDDGDPVQQAGFDGTITLPMAMEMARQEATATASLAEEQKRQSRASMEMAVKNAEEAEAYSERARDLVAQAAAASAPVEKDRLLRQAGEAKQRSTEAGDRARAAYRTGRTMEQASAETRAQAEKAGTLSGRMASEQAAGNMTGLTEALKELKADLDRRKGPEAEPDAAEQLRLTASKLTDDAAWQMRQAGAQREEELALALRLERQTNEAEAAKGRKKQELETQLAELSGQHQSLVEEVEKAFSEADRKEEEALLAKGQAELVRYLANNRELGAQQGPDEGALAGMEERLNRIRQANQALDVGTEYMPLAARSPQERERRTFDWMAAEALALASPEEWAGTTPAQEAEAADPASGQPSEGRTAVDATASMMGGTTDPEDTAEAMIVPEIPEEEEMASYTPDPEELYDPGPVRDGGTSGQEPQTVAAAQADAQHGTQSDAQPDALSPGMTTEDDQGSMAATEDQPASLAPELDAPEPTSPEERAFLLANRLSELEQLRSAEKNRARRDSLDDAIAEQKERIRAFQRGEPAEEPVTAREEYPVPVLTYLAFDMAVLDEELVEEIFPGFDLAMRAIMEGEGSEQEKAVRIHALEMQLADSVDAQTERAMAYLEANPEASAEVLARMERWRRLKNEHVDRANKALADAGREYVASETQALEDLQLVDRATGPRPELPPGISPTPHNDSYIRIEKNPDLIYASEFSPRSDKSLGAIAEKDRDLARMEAMQAEIDSMRYALSQVVDSREYSQLEEKTDRRYDDLLIHQVEVGQRTAFISRTEFKLAKDSAKVLTKAVARQGIAPDEPLVGMARSFESTADSGMDQAKSLRKEADNARDIFTRNALYKQAYALELTALRDMDRAHTVRNYLIGGQAVPGESLTYEEVEWRMFPEALADAMAREEAQASAPEEEAPVSSEAPPAGSPEEEPVAATTVDSSALAAYLDQYYYLDGQEREVVLHGPEESRYFLMKGRSLQDRADAVAARNEAEGAAQLGQVLDQEARTLRREAAAGVAIDEEQVQRLETRASALQHRSDSLEAAAQRLFASADMADTQAAAWMEALPAEQSTAIMDLEQSRRRTEPLLARTRPEPVAPVVAPPVTVVEPAAEVAQAGEEEEERSEDLAVVPVDEVQGDPIVETPVPDAPLVQEPATVEPVREEQVVASEPAPPVSDAVTTPVERTAAPERISPVASAAEPLLALADRPLQQDLFAFNEAPVNRMEPLPIDVPMPTGVVYKVQVGAFRNELPLEAFNDMAPVTGEQAGNGLVRYTAGMFTTAENAREAGARVRARGYRDAFVVAYMDGRRVPLREAMQAERTLAQATVPITPPAEPIAPAAPVTTTTATAPPATTETVAATEPTAPAAVPVNLTDRTVRTTAEDAVLAQYPASAEELLASFEPAEGSTAYYNDPTAAPAEQVETVRGLFFTVQVGVYSKPTPLDRLFNITPLNSELTANGKIRYTTGQFQQEARATQRRNEAITLGVTDAFITAYLNGKRIPIRDARALLAKFGPSILAQP